MTCTRRYQGKRVDPTTLAIINAANHILQKSPYFGRERENLTIVQGGCNRGGVSASAGTHDGGGAIDITAFNIGNRVKVFRLLGSRMWYRRALRGVWSAHGHGITSGVSVSAGAHRQRIAYANRRDGLAGNRRDPDWRPDYYDIRAINPASARGRIGNYYVRKQGTVYRSQPGTLPGKRTCGRVRGRARKNQRVRIVLIVTCGQRTRYGVTDRGNFFPMSALSRTKVK